MLPYSFHDRNSVAVDATLYSILHDGHADYGFGKGLYEKVEKDLKAAGYYYEPYGGGRLDFAKDR